MSSVLFSNLDSLLWSTADVQRRIPIEGSRLQTLMKRHYPWKDELKDGESRRSYSGRMIIWLALSSKLMDLGVSVSKASDMTRFAFSGSLDKEYDKIANSDDAIEVANISQILAIANPTVKGEDRPVFGLTKIIPEGGTFISMAIGSILLDLARRFENNDVSKQDSDNFSISWL